MDKSLSKEQPMTHSSPPSPPKLVTPQPQSCVHYYLDGTVSDYRKKINGEWTEGSVSYSGKTFFVLISQQENKVFIKPNTQKHDCKHCGQSRGYHTFEYEQLFGFGCHCNNFDDNKIVDITDAI